MAGGDRYDLDITRGTREAVAITPDDDAIFARPTRGLYIGTAGAVTVIHADQSTPVTYNTTIAGYVYPWAVKAVYATGTSASDIIGQF